MIGSIIEPDTRQLAVILVDLAEGRQFRLISAGLLLRECFS